MNNASVRIAQIGCGHFAAAQDMPNFHANPRVTCVCCCDLDAHAAQALAKAYGVPTATSDVDAVLADPDIDAVKISTSHEAHLPLIEQAAAAGKHVFCEKPLAMDDRQALRIIGAVRRRDIKLCVDLNRRMAPALRSLRRHWQEHREAPRRHPWRFTETQRRLYPDEQRTHFLARVQDDPLSYHMLHLDPLRGGGLIIGESVHWLDLACWFFAPQVPVEILAWGSTRFSHGIQLTFSAGDTATILFHCGGTFDYPKEMYEVTCLGGLFRSEYFVENQYFGMPGLTRETFPLLRDCLPEVGGDGLAGYLARYRARVEGLANAKEGYGELSVDKGWSAMLDGFVDAVLHDTPSPCDEMAGYLSVYLARLAMRSIELRQSLPVPLDRVDFTVI